MTPSELQALEYIIGAVPLGLALIVATNENTCWVSGFDARAGGYVTVEKPCELVRDR